MNSISSPEPVKSCSSSVPCEAGQPLRPVMKVLGLGGGGCNAVERMMALQMGGVEFIAANTDIQALKLNSAPTRILLGPKVTGGHGAGGNPQRGRAAAEESREAIKAALSGADIVFLTAGMGGGSGTGAIPVAAEIARSLGAVVVGVVTTPFEFEMAHRKHTADEGLANLRRHAHTVVTISNDRLNTDASSALPLQLAFQLADDALRQAVQGITELIAETGLINIDFAHIRRILLMGGGALMAIGQGQGENKTIQAVQQALNHPMLDRVDLSGAGGIIVNFTGGSDLALFEVQEALSGLQELTGDEVELFFGLTNDERMEDRAQVILLVTGLGKPSLSDALFAVKPAKASPGGERDAAGGAAAARLPGRLEGRAGSPVDAPAGSSHGVSALQSPRSQVEAPVDVQVASPAVAVTAPDALAGGAHGLQGANSPSRSDLNIPTYIRRR